MHVKSYAFVLFLQILSITYYRVFKVKPSNFRKTRLNNNKKKRSTFGKRNITIFWLNLLKQSKHFAWLTATAVSHYPPHWRRLIFVQLLVNDENFHFGSPWNWQKRNASPLTPPSNYEMFTISFRFRTRIVFRRRIRNDLISLHLLLATL